MNSARLCHMELNFNRIAFFMWHPRPTSPTLVIISACGLLLNPIHVKNFQLSPWWYSFYQHFIHLYWRPYNTKRRSRTDRTHAQTSQTQSQLRFAPWTCLALVAKGQLIYDCVQHRTSFSKREQWFMFTLLFFVSLSSSAHWLWHYFFWIFAWKPNWKCK